MSIRVKILLSLIVVLVLGGGFWGYNSFLRPTTIAFVNFPDFQMGRISKSNSVNKVKLFALDQKDLENASSYDIIYLFGRGLQLGPEELGYLEKAVAKGTSVYVNAATNPEMDLSNLSETYKETLNEYFRNGGSENYRNLLAFSRYKIHNKPWLSTAPEPPAVLPSNAFFHISEEAVFEDMEAYEAFYAAKGYYKPNAPKIALLTSVPGPFNANRDHLDAIIEKLEAKGWNVYPVVANLKRLEMLQQIDPDLVIYMPHGRLSGAQAAKAVDWLKEKNIPLLTPLSVFTNYDQWIADPRGMSGGMLTMNVVLPEIDGGVGPYTIAAQYPDDQGYQLFGIVPDRFEKYTELIERWLALKKKANADKKVAVYYFKGPGQNALVAANMEVVPSLYNMLKKLQAEGYNVENLPASEKEFASLIEQQGRVLGPYAEGAIREFIESADPAQVHVQDYLDWVGKDLKPEMYGSVVAKYGKAPGSYMAFNKGDSTFMAMAKLQFGNVVLLPQPLPGIGGDSFKLVHGTDDAPPHTYIGAYLWVQNAFKPDAVIHFGTHGSLEFTPGKQIALSSYDWADALIGNFPHFYVYTISNVGEGIIAKRRSYAGLVSHLTPPFLESGKNDKLRQLEQKINQYLFNLEGAIRQQYARTITAEAKSLALLTKAEAEKEILDEADILRLAHIVEEVNTEKITGGLYTLGQAYNEDHLNETARQMAVDRIAYNLAKLDVYRGNISDAKLDDKIFLNKNYRPKSLEIIKNTQEEKLSASAVLATLLSRQEMGAFHQAKYAREQVALEGPNHGGAKIAENEKSEKSSGSAKEASNQKPSHEHEGTASKGHESKETAKHGHPDGTSGASQKSTQLTAAGGSATAGYPQNPEIKMRTQQELFLESVANIDNAIASLGTFKTALTESPEAELNSIINALNGGYIHPSPGGDAVGNALTLPTGRNLYSIDAEKTPSAEAWQDGKRLAIQLLEQHFAKHGEYPQKVSFTLWPGDFIATEGTMIAQIFYLLGVEPVWDPFGRVAEIRLSREEGRKYPSIDVVVQTAGQFRDLAASRMTLINKAVRMAAGNEAVQENFVKDGVLRAEAVLLEKGFTPSEARKFAYQRVFGGVNGNYGTGIMGLVESGSQWDDESQVAITYLNNMGAIYDEEEGWGEFRQGIFEAALQNTSVVVQPRESNTWGALSLDHVYEFMGGLNIAVRQVTGADPDAYFTDFRNPDHSKIQGLEEAIQVETQSTLFNPKYIQEYMNGGASSAERFAETFRNTYGWNVMKPDAITNEIWDQLHDVYVNDGLNLNIHEFFERENPYALQEMTAVMLETYRKGYWKATQAQVQQLADLHTALIGKYDPGCSGFVCDNPKLQELIAANVSEQQKADYLAAMNQTLLGSEVVAARNNRVLEQEKAAISEQFFNTDEILIYAVIGLVLFALSIFWLRRRRRA